MRFKQILLSLALLLLFARVGSATPSYITFPSDIDWVTRESSHFQIIYRRGQDAFGERVLVAAEKAFRLLDPIFPSGPEKTWIVLSDFQDSTNGYALNFPYSHMVLFAAPPNASGQLTALDDWLFSLVLHEYVHIRHLYPVGGLWKPMRTVFGSWVMPIGMMPMHFHEGIATFLETNLTRGGRGKSSTFKMFRRKAVEAKVWGNEFAQRDQMDGLGTAWPHGTNAYFFGYQMYEELWNRKGAKGIRELTESYASGWPYLLGGPLSEVYGESVDFPSLWTSIFDKTREQAKAELAEIRKQPLSKLDYVTATKYYKWDLARSVSGKYIAYRRSSPENGTSIDLIDAVTLKPIRTVESEISQSEGMCWLQKDGKDWLLYTKPVSEFQYSLFNLFAYDFEKERSQPLEFDHKPLDHIQQVACDTTQAQFMVYRESAGEGWVREYDWRKGLKVTREWKVPQGDWISSLFYSNGRWMASRHRERTSLLFWKDGTDPQLKWNLPSHVYGLAPSKTGKFLGIGEFDGRSEVWELDADRREIRKLAAVTGGINSVLENGTDLLVSSYEHGGYDLAKTVPISSIAHPPRTSQPAESPADAEAPKPTLSAVEDYSPASTLFPRTWMPNILFVPDGIQFGAWIPGFDLSQKHLYNFFGGYDTRGLFFADFAYDYRFAKRYTIGAGAYFAPSYFISLKQFLKRWGGSIALAGTIPGFSPSLQLSAMFRRIEQSALGPEFQTVGLGLDISYGFGFKRRPLEVSPRWGTRFSASYRLFPQWMGTTRTFYETTLGFDQYLPAPWHGGHGFYLGTRAGYTEGPFPTSYFEGGGEILFSLYRGSFLNRGFLPGSFLARAIVTQNIEYRCPLWRVERGWGYAPVFLRNIHAAFVGDITTQVSALASRRTQFLFKNFFYSAGFELKSEWNFFFYVPTQIRMGAYHGFGSSGEPLYLTMAVEASL